VCNSTSRASGRRSPPRSAGVPGRVVGCRRSDQCGRSRPVHPWLFQPAPCRRPGRGVEAADHAVAIRISKVGIGARSHRPRRPGKRAWHHPARAFGSRPQDGRGSWWRYCRIRCPPGLSSSPLHSEDPAYVWDNDNITRSGPQVKRLDLSAPRTSHSSSACCHQPRSKPSQHQRIG